MPKTEATLKNEVKTGLNGQVIDFTQINGYCLTYSLFWIKCRVIGFSNSEIGKLLSDMYLPAEENKARRDIIAKVVTNKGRAHDVVNLDASGLLNRSDGVSSRKKLIRKIMRDPGVWLYGGSPKGPGDGHAVAFDTRGNQFCFFDPNTGLYEVPLHAAVNVPNARIEQWFYEYWESDDVAGGISYKRTFRKGSRYLVKYQAGAHLSGLNGGNQREIDLTTMNGISVGIHPNTAYELRLERYYAEP